MIDPAVCAFEGCEKGAVLGWLCCDSHPEPNNFRFRPRAGWVPPALPPAEPAPVPVIPSSPAIEPAPVLPASATIDQGEALGGAKADALGGAKADAGKLGTHLLPTRPLQAVARVLDFGARKYAPNNWRKGIAYTRVYGAVLRHLWAWWQGEAIDAESGQPHLACAACELLFLLEYELGPDEARRAACDDRPEAAS